MPPMVPGAWWVEVEVPYDADWSKNRMWGHRVILGRGGRKPFVQTYMTAPAKAHRDRLVAALRAVMEARDVRVWQNKLGLDVHVVKGDHRGDALNALDLVSDAVEKATGLNDRWYYASVTWAVDATRPRIACRVEQTIPTDVQVCPGCSRHLGYEEFPKDSSSRTGRASRCRACAAAKRREGR